MDKHSVPCSDAAVADYESLKAREKIETGADERVRQGWIGRCRARPTERWLLRQLRLPPGDEARYDASLQPLAWRSAGSESANELLQAPGHRGEIGSRGLEFARPLAGLIGDSADRRHRLVDFLDTVALAGGRGRDAAR